jgi:hypothetical protein
LPFDVLLNRFWGKLDPPSPSNIFGVGYRFAMVRIDTSFMPLLAKVVEFGSFKDWADVLDIEVSMNKEILS